MSLNSWWCDWFDMEGKGFVTVWNIVYLISMLAVAVVCVLSSLYGGYIAYLIVSTISYGSPINAGSPINDALPPFWEFPLTVFVVTLGGVLWFGGWYVLMKIAAIRVAKCELKKDEEVD